MDWSFEFKQSTKKNGRISCLPYALYIALNNFEGYV